MNFALKAVSVFLISLSQAKIFPRDSQQTLNIIRNIIPLQKKVPKLIELHQILAITTSPTEVILFPEIHQVGCNIISQ